MSRKINIYNRKITISKHQSNTHYSIHVTDSYGTEHFLGYSSELGDDMLTEIERQARDIWANEVKPKEDLLSKAIANCIKLDIKRGVEPSLD
tara:strand:+ start:548 stop:823 length:276 start_codon:yes stop_codon:yes gene_type:complete